jgi:hypothetical protein
MKTTQTKPTMSEYLASAKSAVSAEQVQVWRKKESK